MNNFKNMYARLTNRGGELQQDRMIRDKQKTLERAVQYSYQGAKVKKINSDDIVPALINPNKLLADYDEKIISVEYKYGFSTGTIFRWIQQSELQKEDSYWLVYLQDLTELAYFRAHIRRCCYKIQYLLNGELYSTYAAIRGPKESIIDSTIKEHVIMDEPNYNITLLVPKTSENLEYFQRYAKFYLQTIDTNYTPTCWRVEAIDHISLPNILEIHAREYYINSDTDNTEIGLVDGLVEPVLPNKQIEEENKKIVGDNFIKPKFIYKFQYVGDESAVWIFDKNLPIKTTINNTIIELMWDANYSGQFDLYYGTAKKTIVVESLFS